MKNIWKNFLSLPWGMRIFLLCNVLGFPILLLGHYMGLPFARWVDLRPPLVWQGEVWRLLSYAFFSAPALPWIINGFWLFTLISILRRDWSSAKCWMFCLVAAVAGAAPLALLNADVSVLGAGAVVFGLLAAWDCLYRRERLIMLGLGEMSVRQAAIIIALINGLIVFFSCGGWRMTLSLLCGGVAGWLYLAIGDKQVMSRDSRVTDSERIARLEL